MAYASTATAISSTPTTLFLPRKTFPNWEFRSWKRRRVKSKHKPKLHLRNELGPLLPSSSSSSAFDFLSSLPANWIPPAAVGFASALALAFSQNRISSKKSRVLDSDFDSDLKLNSDSGSRVLDIGEWILFTSPAPFNRFVLLRCPSISFEGGEFLEDVNEKLVKEEKHYVRLDSGRIRVKRESGGSEEEELEYQRECVRTEDGGVIGLDWPANLDLREERGLDTTVLLIPGTPKGSMDSNVKSFVCECLRRGLFPVVMNPRGCAGSPLTTPRLFTAADSDDINSAIQFIKTARPWSSLMGVGWGYGANMLTKYLAEAGEKTPLTAATCIDNPFDLDDATRTSPYSTTFDKKLTGGLINILKSNKELFQGRRKGFDVDKALSAESVRDFEEAISMISYGFNTLEEFYSASSTRSSVEKLKIPVLFIQNDDGTVPLFSIPRGLIAENPFTNLLLCSCLPSNFTAISWYHQVTIEWLTAVELGLLKGRHPLLQDIDVTINPSKSLALVEGRMPATSDRIDSIMNPAELDSPDEYMDFMNEIIKKNGTAAYIQSDFNQGSQGKPDSDDEALSENNGNDSSEADSPKDARGQMLQTAQVVMNMLDVTMPGTLKDEEKKKVLEAVGRGETIMKALQDAVPEDVRGKLTSSVSEILQAQGKNLNFERLLSAKQLANLSSGLRSKMKEKVDGSSDVRVESNDHPSEKGGCAGDLRDSIVIQADKNEHAEVRSKAQPHEESAKSSDLPGSRSVNINGANAGLTSSSDSQNNNDKHDSDMSSKQTVAQPSEIGEGGSDTTNKISYSSNAGGSDSVETVTQNKQDSGMPSNQKVAQPSELGEDGSEITNKISHSSNVGGSDSVETVTQNNRSQGDEVSQMDDKGTNMSAKAGSEQDFSDQSETGSPDDVKPSESDETPVSSFSEGQLSEKGNHSSRSKDEKSVQPLPDQNAASASKTLNFSVSQALDALTGLDDSTQVAVNSVFSVIEDMLTQLEEKKNDSSNKKEYKNNNAKDHSVNEKTCIDYDVELQKQINGDYHEAANPLDVESVDGNKSDQKTNNNLSPAERKEDKRKESLIVGKLVAQDAETPTNINKLIFCAPSNPYTEAFYKEYLRKYILSKVEKMKPLNVDVTTALLNYNPEKGHWLLQKQSKDLHDVVPYKSRNKVENAMQFAKENVIDNIIEPSYVILDSEKRGELAEDLQKKLNNHLVHRCPNLGKSKISVKTVVLDSLKVEISRRLSAADMKEMEAGIGADMEEVANAVNLAIQYGIEESQHPLTPDSDCNTQECNWLTGIHVVEAISLAVQNTSYLKRVLPVGVIVGSTLAALRKFFELADVQDLKYASPLDIDQDLIKPNHTDIMEGKPEAKLTQVGMEAKHDRILEKSSRYEWDDASSDVEDEDDHQEAQPKALNRDSLVVGAVTAALGAPAMLSQQDVLMGSESIGTSSGYFKEKLVKTETAKDGEVLDDKQQSNVVTSLAEKAMSVAAPIVPTKEGGEVDQERLVAMLAELGQRGGMLKLVGKLALLWGGLRGAMSLTDRLISFLRIAERPLWQRVLGFFCMALVLWSPVLVPLLPTLFHNWATHNSSRIAELACVLGLYYAVTILIVQWGIRIRGHEFPLKQYGLDFMSSEKIQDFMTGLAGGILLVLSIQSLNALLGFAKLSMPSHLVSSSLNLTTKLKAYGQLFLLAAQGFIAAAGIAFVEELLFRAWLLEEIAADIGYHPAILLSALAFSLSQRSLYAVPGLWLLSLSLAGARLRKGSLFIPIGMRTGIMASSFVLQMGSFLTCEPKYRLWMGGAHPSQPFTGVVGLLFALLLAAILYPRQPCLGKKIHRPIRP